MKLSKLAIILGVFSVSILAANAAPKAVTTYQNGKIQCLSPKGFKGKLVAFNVNGVCKMISWSEADNILNQQVQKEDAANQKANQEFTNSLNNQANAYIESEAQAGVINPTLAAAATSTN
ncbi:MAG: hypothetical protein R3Y52_01265 [Psittacicella sp.]